MTGPLPDDLQPLVNRLRLVASRRVRAKAVAQHDENDVLTGCFAAAALAFLLAIVLGLA